jgi:hypothetical protein
MSVEDASLIDTSSARDSEEAGSKGMSFVAESCPFPKCRVNCGRPQELERHICGHHLPYRIYCVQQGCNWTGNRRYTLRNHLADKHAGAPMPEVEAYMIYDARGLVKQLLNKEVDVEQAVGEAQSLFQKKAVQLGKLGIRHWMKRLEATCVSTSSGV